jgi:hypothetical protein
MSTTPVWSRYREKCAMEWRGCTMTSEAIILFSEKASIIDRHLARLTAVLGAQFRMVRVDQRNNAEAFFTGLCRESAPCIMVSARSLAAIFQATAIPPGVVAQMFACVPYVLVYGITPEAQEMDGIRHLTEGLVSSVVPLERPEYAYHVSATERAITHEFSGLTFGPINADIDCGLILKQQHTAFSTLVSINNLPFFAALKKHNTRIFLLACRDMADLEAQTGGSWSTHAYFSRLVPAMMFLQHVFREQLWHNPRRYANFIIDDPLLRESYGCLNYAQLLQEMDRCKFATTIAFIPWNYKRTSDAVARLFRERSDRFSLCLHGSNHTEGEFASTELRRLNAQLHVATQRMRAHEQHTGLPYAEVMVFPQGKFSTVSLTLLKCHNYLAAINSIDSVIPMDLGEAHGLTIADFLAPAISKYGDFPLFVRRYPGTVADFAFDLFLGKPALLVEHHTYFKNGYDKIQEFVTQINALSTNLQWMNLEDLISNTYLQRTIYKDNIECKIFANYQVISNKDTVKKQYIIRKHEDGVVPIKKVSVDGNDYPYEIEDGYLSICIDISPENSREISIIYKNMHIYEREDRSLRNDIKVSMRRYLSEFRDNYMSRNEVLLKSLYRVKKRLF